MRHAILTLAMVLGIGAAWLALTAPEAEANICERTPAACD